MKNVHQVSDAWIRNHDLLIMSILQCSGYTNDTIRGFYETFLV